MLCNLIDLLTDKIASRNTESYIKKYRNFKLSYYHSGTKNTRIHFKIPKKLTSFGLNDRTWNDGHLETQNYLKYY